MINEQKILSKRLRKLFHSFGNDIFFVRSINSINWRRKIHVNLLTFYVLFQMICFCFKKKNRQINRLAYAALTFITPQSHYADAFYFCYSRYCTSTKYRGQNECSHFSN